MHEDHSGLDGDQHVTLYPTFVFHDEATGTWKLPINGFVYENGREGLRQRMFLGFMQQLLKIDENVIKSNEIFHERIRGFLQSPQKHVPVVFNVGQTGQKVTGVSKRTGHVRVEATLDTQDIPDSIGANSTLNTEHGSPLKHKLNCRVALAPGDQRQFEHEVDIIPSRGVSVISDIDDTIKISQVAHSRQLLHNTFLNRFATVPGMSQLFQQWEASGAAFHYVSSSPWQLYTPLDALLRGAKFPTGSYHLRSYRFGDPSVFKIFLSRKRNKYNIIKSIFRMFPHRRFVLVGDSGEKDPEIYGKIARKFPMQIERILIRRVEGREWTRSRVAKAFRKIPLELWQTFRVPTQIREVDFNH